MNVQPPRHASSFPDTRLEPGDDLFPAELGDLGPFTPPFLHARGNLSVLATRPRIGIVGTRRATAYGLRVTRELAGAFARAGACVISGLATGIDGCAHTAALEANGATIAVLGTGLGSSYPKAHRHLQQTIGERGLLLTELELDDHGMPFTFLHRNRIIAALASLVIVVEAPARSGALDTAVHAIDLGRDLAAVPGPIDQPQSEGSNGLLRDGAQVITSLEDALALAHLTPPPRAPSRKATGDEALVWKALARGALHMDALCQSTGLPAAQCLTAVTRLELAGSVECALTGEVRRR